MNGQSITLNIGSLVAKDASSTDVYLAEAEHLAEHMAIYGGTGRGKSKLLEFMLRQLIAQERGFCLIDPHGDLTEDIVAFIQHQFSRGGPLAETLLRKLHYLEPSSKTTFAFDPFACTADKRKSDRYVGWLQTKVDAIAKAVLRVKGEIDFKDMSRLERWMKTVLYASGFSLDDQGMHLPISESLILLDKDHPYFRDIYDRIVPRLSPWRYRRNLEKLLRTPPARVDEVTESTHNWLGSFLSAPVQAILGCERPSLDFRRVIQEGGIILANMRKSDDFSEEHGNAVGGLIINEILDTVENTPRGLRTPYYLIIDEASRYIGKDLINALAQTRKWLLSLVFCVQDLTSLRDDHADMTDKVISQCGVQMSFQQRNQKDRDVLGALFGVPNLDFTPLVHEVERSDGYDWTPVEEYTHSQGTGHITDSGTGKSVSEPEDTRIRTDTDSSSQRKGYRTVDTKGVSQKMVPLSKTKLVKQHQGRLQETVEDQLHKVSQTLAVLPRRALLVSIQEQQSFQIETHEVVDPFADAPHSWKQAHIDRIKETIHTIQPCYFVPSLTGDAEQRRVEEFLTSVSPRRSPRLEEGHGEETDARPIDEADSDGFGI